MAEQMSAWEIVNDPKLDNARGIKFLLYGILQQLEKMANPQFVMRSEEEDEQEDWLFGEDPVSDEDYPTASVTPLTYDVKGGQPMTLKEIEAEDPRVSKFIELAYEMNQTEGLQCFRTESGKLRVNGARPVVEEYARRLAANTL